MSHIYFPPSVRHFAPQYQALCNWVDHVPFGYDLISAIRPQMLVELGTRTGLSYFTFCQSMKENNIDGLCYAIDPFEGSDQLGESIFNSINDHNRQHYHGFSYLVRMGYENVLRHFNAGNIDLLHIDCLHTHKDISDSFANWYPKVKPGGIILLHNVQTREPGCEVWKFWDEICGQHETFTFKSGFGLGVLRKAGGDRTKDSELLKLLFAEQSESAQARLQEFYVHAAQHLENTHTLKSLTPKPKSPAP